LKGKKNGELLRAAEAAGYDVLLTVDQGIPHQRPSAGRRKFGDRLRNAETGRPPNSGGLVASSEMESGVGVVGWKAVTEIDWQALIQQNLHAILASKESLASSSA